MSTLRAPTVYIVDDDPDICDSAATLLATEGILTKAFHSAEEFLQHYSPTAPECLLLDLRMSGMGGLELMRLLTEKQIHIPTIFLTGNAEQFPPNLPNTQDIVALLEKPVRPDVLLNSIHRALNLE